MSLQSFKLSYVVTPRTPGLIAGSLSNNAGDGHENVTHTKWIRASSNFIALTPSRAAGQM